MSLTLAETHALLLDLLPPGARDLYDFDSGTSNACLFFEAIAQALKNYGSDMADTLRTETTPGQWVQRLPDWEDALGIAGTKIATYGTTADRQAQVLSRLRESGASTLPNILGAATALLGYEPEIVEISRSALTTAHTYACVPIGGPDINPFATATTQATVADVAKVSGGGALMSLTLTFPAVEELQINFVCSDITSDPVQLDAGTWTTDTGPVTGRTYQIGFTSFVGFDVAGVWDVQITNTGLHAGTLDAASVFVEGIGRDENGYDGLGAAQFEFSITFSPDNVTTGATIDDLLALAKRWAPAHVNGGAVYVQSDAVLCAAADDTYALADQCVAC